MSSWKEYFTPPFKDTGVYIVDSNDKRIAHWLTDAKAKHKLIDKINGVLMTKSKFPFLYMNDKICLIAPDGRLVPMIFMRCRGYLEGCESPDFIQDNLAEYIISQLNS